MTQKTQKIVEQQMNQISDARIRNGRQTQEVKMKSGGIKRSKSK